MQGNCCLTPWRTTPISSIPIIPSPLLLVCSWWDHPRLAAAGGGDTMRTCVCVCVSVNLLYNSHTSPYTAWWGILNKTELLSTAICGCLNAAWLEYALRTKPLFKCFSFLCRIHNSLEVVRASWTRWNPAPPPTTIQYSALQQFLFLIQSGAEAEEAQPPTSAAELQWVADDRDRDTQTCNHVIGPLRDIIAENLGQRRRSVAGESRPVAMAAGLGTQHFAHRPLSAALPPRRWHVSEAPTHLFYFIFLRILSRCATTTSRAYVKAHKLLWTGATLKAWFATPKSMIHIPIMH